MKKSLEGFSINCEQAEKEPTNVRAGELRLSGLSIRKKNK